MSEFKFACPVCGQHITCDSTKSGTKLDCPTCFQKIIVPAAPTAAGSKLILTASQAQSRPVPQNGATAEAVAPAPSSAGKFPVAVIVVLVCVAGAVFAFRGKLFKGSSPSATGTNSPGGLSSSAANAVNDTNWTLNLAGVVIPDAPATGRISGRSFTVRRAILRGGTLELRQGPDLPPNVGITINLFARQGEDLARQSINIEADRTNAPRAVLRFKNDPGQFVAQPFFQGYALRLEFGQVTNSYLPGKIYFCAPDAAKSWVAGTFEAEIRKPPPPKFRPPRSSGRKR